MNEELRREVANELGCQEGDLIWSDKCNNPKTAQNHPDGNIKCEQGYWVIQNKNG